MSLAPADRRQEFHALMLISSGLIVILLAIIVGIFVTPRALPNWAENVLVSIGTAAALKLGDCLATLVALASGRSVERLGNQLASAPASAPAPTDAREAADQVAVAAETEASRITGGAP